MTAPRWLRVAAGLALLAGAAPAQDSTAVKTARITYFTGSTAYLDAGRLDGLVEGARVEVRHGGVTVATLIVTFLASHRAACDLGAGSVALAVGDSVRYVPVAPARDSTAVAPAAAVPRWSPDAFRGRVGVEYFSLWQRGGLGGRFSQPSLSVRVGGIVPGAPAASVALDVRARRTATVLSDGTETADGHSRVYQAAVTYVPAGSAARITLGRQISGNLASIGLFDGALAELQGPRWSTGAFAGTQPEPLELGFSSAVIEGGGYVQRHSPVGTAAPWALTLGASGSYTAAHANREFAFLSGSVAAPRLTAFATQELDYYRWWKLLPGMHPLSLTSTLAFAQFRPSAVIAFDAGFDNRRNVRLYRDVVSPETAFDDAYRQGAWLGVSLRPAPRYRVGLEARSSRGGVGGEATACSAFVNLDRLTGLGVGVRTRGTRYINPQVSGWLGSGAVTADPSPWLHLELNGGLRSERDALADPVRTSVSWIGTDLDATLARAWYLTVSTTRQRGGFDGNDQIYAGLSVRF
jgi:hypothetical protein